MRKIPSLLSVLLCFLSLSAFSQQVIHPDAEIATMVSQVSRDSLQSYVHALVSFGTRQTLSSQGDPHHGIGAARKWVLGEFQQFAKASGGRMNARIDFWEEPADHRRVNRPVRMGNVMAVLKGTDPADDRVFIVSGHLDSRNTDIMDSTDAAPGANDDASGVAAVLEMARIMSRHPLKATVIFVAVSGEEQGLLGSTHLAEEAKQKGWNVAAMVNNDMIGQSTSSGTDKHDNTRVRVFSEGIPAVETSQEAALRKALGGENDSRSRELARYISNVAVQYVPNLNVQLIYRRDRFLRGGDHIPFQERGFTAVRLTDFYENFQHQHQDVRMVNGVQYGDLQKFMDFEYLRKNTCLNLATLACLASAPSVPTEAKIDVSRLTNYTRLFWKTPQYGHATAYYVLMRQTDAPMWQKKFYTEKTEMTLPYSKDNYLFAIQAVGKDGSLSMAVFPGISR